MLCFFRLLNCEKYPLVDIELSKINGLYIQNFNGLYLTTDWSTAKAGIEFFPQGSSEYLELWYSPIDFELKGEADKCYNMVDNIYFKDFKIKNGWNIVLGTISKNNNGDYRTLSTDLESKTKKIYAWPLGKYWIPK